jgi:excisionase family DNA binding protein
MIPLEGIVRGLIMEVCMKEFYGIFNLPNVARYLGISPRTVYRLLAKKSLPGTKVGRSWRFQKETIDEWLRENRI